MTIYALAHDVLDYDTGATIQDDLDYGTEPVVGQSANLTFPAPVTTDCWAHFIRSTSHDTLYGGSGGAAEFAFYSSTGQEILRLVRDETSNPYIRFYNASGTTIGTYYWNDITVRSANSINDFDFHFEFGSANRIRMYIQGSLSIDISGHGHTSVNKFRVYNGDSALNAKYDFHGEFICADWITIGARVKSIPLGTPTTNDFTTGTASLFQDRVENGTQVSYLDDYMITATSGTEYITPASSYTKDTTTSVVAVDVKNWAFALPTSPVKTLKQKLVIGGTAYDVSTNTLNDTQELYKTTVETNPATSASWTESDVQGLSIGVEVLT